MQSGDAVDLQWRLSWAKINSVQRDKIKEIWSSKDRNFEGTLTREGQGEKFVEPPVN